MPKISIVVPVFNEEESLDVLFREIREEMERLRQPFEIVFVNDGSTDTSLAKIKIFQSQLKDAVRIVDLPSRSGQTFALRKGLESTGGDIVVTLDADLQNDPADISRLLEKMNEGFDVVCGWRMDRNDPWLKKKLSKLGNIFQRLISGLTVHDVSCTLRAYKKECIKKLNLVWEGQHRFIPLMLFKEGCRVGEIASHHRHRTYGYSKYTHKRVFKVVGDFFKVLFARRSSR